MVTDKASEAFMIGTEASLQILNRVRDEAERVAQKQSNDAQAQNDKLDTLLQQMTPDSSSPPSPKGEA